MFNRRIKPASERMSLGEHLEELRRRLFYALGGLAVAMGLSLLFADWVLALLRGPFERAVPHEQLVATKLQTGITMYLNVALVSGLILAAPWVFYHLWAFVSAGLYPHERRRVLRAAPFSAALFVGGAMFFLFVTADMIIGFLMQFNFGRGLAGMIRVEEYIGFIIKMMIACGLAFQAPLAVLVLVASGLVSLRKINHYRRHVIVVIAVLAAVITPPDPWSMLAVGGPMYLLYELGVLLAWLGVRKKNLSDELDEKAQV
jgi:sec-independent protein translocase protein TatC